MPLTFWTFTIGVAAIIGLPFLAGFFSKDAILYLAFANNKAVFAVLAFTAVLTALYMVRLWKTHVLRRAAQRVAAHAHEGGLTLTAPLVVLAALSIVGGFTGDLSEGFRRRLRTHPRGRGFGAHDHSRHEPRRHAPRRARRVVLLPSAPTDSLAQKSPGLFGALVALRNSFDAVYDYYVAKIQQRFAMLLNFLEQIFLAGLIVRGFAGVVGLFGMGARALHVGNLNAYVYWFLFGVVALWAFATGALAF